MSETDGNVPYWLVNVPPSGRPSECPDFLINANAKDRGILSTPDSQYHRLTWAEVREIIRTNRIDLLQRVPSELRAYLQCMAKLKAEWGSVINYIQSERLQWQNMTPSGPPFTNPGISQIDGYRQVQSP